MAFNPQDVMKADQEAGEVEQAQFPLLQWVNGAPAFKRMGGVSYHGGWFVSGEQLDLLGHTGWEEYELTHRDGTSTKGFAAESISIAMVRMRRRWEIYSTGRREVFAWNEYEKATADGARPVGRTHLLCAVQGLEEFGLLTVTLRGTVAKQFTDYRSGLFTQFNRSVVAAANALSEPDSPSWRGRYFWMPICANASAKGEPVFTEVGSGNNTSKVTMPVLMGIPATKEKVDVALLSAIYVGPEYLEQLDTLWHETQDWQDQWAKTSQAQEQEDLWQKDKNGPAPDESLDNDVSFSEDIPF